MKEEKKDWRFLVFCTCVSSAPSGTFGAARDDDTPDEFQRFINVTDTPPPPPLPAT